MIIDNCKSFDNDSKVFDTSIFDYVILYFTDEVESRHQVLAFIKESKRQIRHAPVHREWDQLDDVYDDNLSPVRNNYIRIQQYCQSRLREEMTTKEKITFLRNAISWFKLAPCLESEAAEKQNVSKNLNTELANIVSQQGEIYTFPFLPS